MTKEKLSAILVPWLACPWGVMAHTSDECLQVGVASFTYLEVGLMVAMALCFVLIGMLWRYGAKMERRAKKAERDRDVCQQWYQALKHKPQEAPKAEMQKSKNTDVHDAPQDDEHSANDAPQDPQRSPTIELDVTPAPPRKLYAKQDAQDAKRLISLSQEFDPYEHIFVRLTMDRILKAVLNLWKRMPQNVWATLTTLNVATLMPELMQLTSNRRPAECVLTDKRPKC